MFRWRSTNVSLAIRCCFAGDSLLIALAIDSLSIALAIRYRLRWRFAIAYADSSLSRALTSRWRKHWRTAVNSAGMLLIISLAINFIEGLLAGDTRPIQKFCLIKV
jgi:hypothetical protein